MPTIDADAHVIETMETWSVVAEEEPRLMPIITRRMGGAEIRNSEGAVQQEFWVINGRVHNRDRNLGTNTPEESREMRSIAARLEHMDALEVDIQILFPTLLLRPIADHPRLDYILSKSYNRWLADICKNGDGRLRWAVVPPLMSPERLREELEFGKENGACAVFMRPLERERAISDEIFFPLYELAQELDLAVCPHLGNGSFAVHDFFNHDSTFSKFKLPMIGATHSLLFKEIPKKFPRLRWGIIEAGSDWLPFLLSDIRQRLLRQGKRAPDDMLAANNMYVTCQTYENLPHVLDCAGLGNLVIGTDYGHSDFSSEIEALRLLRRDTTLPAGAVDRILWDNPRALYGIH